MGQSGDPVENKTLTFCVAVNIAMMDSFGEMGGTIILSLRLGPYIRKGVFSEDFGRKTVHFFPIAFF
jgi:hypothetical protein